jgi:hypothetical protein
MRNVVKNFIFFLLCFLLVLSVSASSIPAGTYSLTGVSAGSSSLSGSITLDSNGLATMANLTFGNAAYGSPTFSNIASTGTSGNSPEADFAYISGSNGQVTLYYFNTLNGAGGINICESGSGCTVASSLQIYSPNYQAGLTGGSLTAGPASTGLTPEMSTFVLLMTGLVMIAAVLLVRPAPELANANEPV